MKRKDFLATASVAVIAPSSLLAKDTTIGKGDIIHSVIFDLKHGESDPKTKKFLEDGKKILSKIPTVRDFQVFRQVSPKCDYTYGFSMVFTNQAAYQEYNDHPDHVSFVNDRWIPEVARFQEIDYIKY